MAEIIAAATITVLINIVKRSGNIPQKLNFIRCPDFISFKSDQNEEFFAF